MFVDIAIQSLLLCFFIAIHSIRFLFFVFLVLVVLFYSLLGSFWAYFLSLWSNFGVLWESFWCHFGVLGRLRAPWDPKGSLDRKSMNFRRHLTGSRRQITHPQFAHFQYFYFQKKVMSRLICGNDLYIFHYFE